MRTFIAVDIPEKQKKELERVVSFFKEKYKKGIKWVKPDNIHLTLKFLGDVSPKKADDIIELLSDIKISDISLKISGIGAFPSLSRPSVLWAGIVSEGQSLQSLASQIENKLLLLGFEKEKRKFSPHLTLARIKTQIDKSFTQEIIKGDEFFSHQSFRPDGFNLYKSELGKEGAKYFLLHTFKS